MQTRIADRRITWLVAGAVLGMAIAYYCPTEPALADTAASGDKFSMATCNTLAGNSDAVFVLDMVTGRLLGAAYNTQTGGFTQTYARSLAADFGVTTRGEYVMVSGLGNLRSTGGGPPATGVIYVGEMTSGMVNMYGFLYQQSPALQPTKELVLLASFPWRQSIN